MKVKPGLSNVPHRRSQPVDARLLLITNSGPQHGNSLSGEMEGKKETQRAIDRETHKQRRALSRQGAADRKRHTEAEEGLRAAAEAELS